MNTVTIANFIFLIKLIGWLLLALPEEHFVLQKEHVNYNSTLVGNHNEIYRVREEQLAIYFDCCSFKIEIQTYLYISIKKIGGCFG